MTNIWTTYCQVFVNIGIKCCQSIAKMLLTMAEKVKVPHIFIWLCTTIYVYGSHFYFLSHIYSNLSNIFFMYPCIYINFKNKYNRYTLF